ncbi:hypothetical protein LR48_Vigan04g066200 [Vigna angularis]|uniref:Putative plant transposon protein domain-containing protein n=1 Tax=Phaseolus angularis TaxID=3914 RepID=A0A0L9UD76_PHAAN|nr:hypothetical protein LR48_Vigan04g066200 [Vigna angularis]
MTSLSGRRVKTAGNKRKEKEQYYSHQFRTAAHERYFPSVNVKKVLMERRVGMIPTLAPQFRREVSARGWGNLATYPAPASIPIVKEFYTNAKTLGGEHETYTSYLRGKKISFDADTINTFLGTDWEEERCQYERAMAKGVDYEDVERTLCVPGWHCERSISDVPIHIKRVSLIPLAKYWLTFSQANIHPCSHMSDITTQRAILLYCIFSGREVNLGAVIAEEIKSCARAPRKKLDEAHFSYYCSTKEQATTRPPQQAPRVHRRAPPPAQGPAHEAASFQMRDMYMSLMEARMMALYRGEQELLRTLTSAFPDRSLFHRRSLQPG